MWDLTPVWEIKSLIFSASQILKIIVQNSLGKSLLIFSEGLDIFLFATQEKIIF